MIRIAVLGLGNPVLRDDSVGLRVAEAVEARLADQLPFPDVDVRVVQDEAGGWSVLDHVEGCQAMILIDASTLEPMEPGELRWYDGRALLSPRVGGPHSIDLFSALELGRKLGMTVPDEVHVLGIGIEDAWTFSEEPGERVAAAVEPAADMVLARLGEIVARVVVADRGIVPVD